MKKILLQFAGLALVIVAIFVFTGSGEGWIEPPEEAPTGDIILSGQKYSGKVVVNITLHPDGTGIHEGNGEESPATWEKGEGDVAMVVHFNVKGTDYDMNVTDTGTGYSAMYPLVADMELTGGKPVRDIMLSGQKYSGKVVVKIILHPDGTLEHDGNGTITEGTWESGTGDVAMVADMQLTGSKTGASEAPAAVEETAEEKQQEAPAPTEAPAAEVTAAPSVEDSGYAPNTLVLVYVADINEQLTGNFSSPSSVWGPALGASGTYTPTESEDLLFSWDSTGKSKELDFYANGTYEFRFTKMSITERGTWSFEGWKLKLTTEAGREIAAELTK